MLCRICGTPVKDGEKFCSLCGEKVEVIEEIQQNQPQQPYGGQPNNQQAYGGQSYRRQTYGQGDSRQSYRRQQSYGQPYDRQSYGEPYGRQSFNNMYYNTAARSKKGLWIALGLFAVAAVAAVLILGVPGDNQAVSQGMPAQRTLPFKGDTLQTKFANDNAEVVFEALDIFGNVGIDLNAMAEQPFDMKLDMAVKSMGESADITMDMAYDNETLGMNMNAEGTSIKMLLIEDVLYMDALDSAVGIDLNSTANLSKPMTLQERFTALGEGLNLPQSTSGEYGYNAPAGLLMQSASSAGDYTALNELLINSIDESCFKSSGSKTTLTLDTGDIVDTLRKFAGKLEADKELKKKYEDFIKNNYGTSEDVIKQINDAADSLEGQKDTLDLGLVWEVSYKNGKPASFEIKADDGGKEYAYSFGYEKKEDSTDIMFEMTPGSSSAGVSGTCNFKKAGSGTEFEGTMISQGRIMAFYGSIAFSGNNTHGTITMNMPDVGEEATIDFNLTLNIGMPYFDIKNDGRFKIDTDSADIIDGSSMFETSGLPLY